MIMITIPVITIQVRIKIARIAITIIIKFTRKITDDGDNTNNKHSDETKTSNWYYCFSWDGLEHEMKWMIKRGDRGIKNNHGRMNKEIN